MDFVNKNLKAIIAGGIAIVILVLALSWYGVTQSVQSTGNSKEASLSAVYADGANFLGSCVSRTAQSANVATAQADKLKEVYAAAVAGRYDNGSKTAVDNGKLFSAIVEAYPDTSQISKTFQDVLAVINGCRTDYRDKQSVIQDKVRDFNAWRTGSWKVRTFGGDKFPNDNLYVDLPEQARLTGQAALSKINKPIIDGGTATTYKTGVEDIQNPFATSTASPTK